MEYKHLGGLKVPQLSFGTATFGGVGDFFRAWGTTDVAEAKRLIDVCLEHGANCFDSANVYATCRLCSDERLRIAGEFAGDDDLLLIAARKRSGRRLDGRRAHIEVGNELSGPGDDFAQQEHHAAPGKLRPALSSQNHVVLDRFFEDQAAATPVFWNVR